MINRKIIGLTGVYCSGKNHIALLLKKRGLPVLDVDKLGHEAIESEKTRIVARYGEDILSPDLGSIDRKKLGEKVFGKSGELAALEEIIHPVVNKKILEWAEDRKEKVCVINAALLHRSSVFTQLDAIILVEAPFFTRLFRARKRDNLGFLQILRRLCSQKKNFPQFSIEKTDIYRVGNPSKCRIFGLQKQGSRTTSRVDEILSLIGIEQIS